MTEVDKLYKSFETLNGAKENILDHSDKYMDIIAAVNGTDAEKKLACQFIPKFFKNFPDLMNVALNAHLDLCEDQDSTIRRLAIRALPGFCSGLPGVASRISAILTQMLFSEDIIEFNIVQTSLFNLFLEHPTNALQGLFQQMRVDEPPIRQQSLKFINDNLLQQAVVKDQAISTLIVDELLNLCEENILDDVQFETAFKILANPNLPRSQFKTKIENLLNERLSTLNENTLNNVESRKKLLMFLNNAKIFGVVGPFFEVFLKAIFTFSSNVIKNLETDETILDLFHHGYEACKTPNLNYEELLNILYKINFLDAPPLSASPELIEQSIRNQKFNWDYLESIFLILHYLYIQFPSFMEWNIKDTESFNPLKERFQYLHRILTVPEVSTNAPKAHPRIVAPGESESPVKVVLTGSKSTISSVIKKFSRSKKNLSLNLMTTPLGHKRIEAPEGSSSSKIRPSTELYLPPCARDPSSKEHHPPQATKTYRKRYSRRYQGYQR